MGSLFKTRAILAALAAAGVTGLAVVTVHGGYAMSAPSQPPIEVENTQEAPMPTDAEQRTANRLAGETSPYLRQHAHNPVDWHPWGGEALARARGEDKPIFLSIGYSACHWCHVMERESFEDEAIAAFLNEHFVNIKVDREERPDLDDIYMQAVQAMTGSGGWPLTVFLTPDLKPFYGGTYFPPDTRMGRPGFMQLIQQVARAWQENRDAVLDGAGKVSDYLEQVAGAATGAAGDVHAGLVAQAANALAAQFDSRDGGFGPAPKFPSPPAISVLFRHFARTGEERYRGMALFTLRKMHQGGLYDHIGGGFHRYSTDAQWLVPHFEKMLYDNAQLAEAYLEAYQVTGGEFYRDAAEDTFAYVLRDMQHPDGGFYSSEDADSEGQEGVFYLWTHDELKQVLGEEDAALFAERYNVRPRGNFSSHEPYHEGRNILHLTEDSLGTAIPDEKLAGMKRRLLEARSKRMRPGRDDKILTSWNALMIGALAKGYQVTGEQNYLEAARRAARFVLGQNTHEGRVLRMYPAGGDRVPGYLDDHAFLVGALTDLYEADFDTAWLDEAGRVAGAMLEHFWGEESGLFYYTAAGREDLLVRMQPVFDGAEPSGNSAAAMALLRLARLRDNGEYDRVARRVLSTLADQMAEVPRGHLKTLCAVDFAVSTPVEVALAGPRDSDSTAAFLEELHGHYLPNKVVALLDPESMDPAKVAESVPLLAGKEVKGGETTAYVCENYACKEPVNTVEALRADLTAAQGPA